VGEGTSILSGELVRDLVARNEDVIEALETRLPEIERLAAEAERAVRAPPALAKVDPEVARGIIPDPPLPAVIDNGRARTTVVQRPRDPAHPGRGGTTGRGAIGRRRTPHPVALVVADRHRTGGGGPHHPEGRITAGRRAADGPIRVRTEWRAHI
jgi:hypothetical protein